MRQKQIKLTEKQKEKLKKIKGNSKIWKRARTILLLNGKETIENIAKIFGVHRNTIGRWSKEWREEERIHQKNGRGRKLKLTKEMILKLEEFIKGENSSIVKAIKMIKNEYNISVTKDTIRKYLKKKIYL
jgi:transposase